MMKQINVHLDYTVRVEIAEEEDERDPKVEDYCVERATDIILDALSTTDSKERLDAVERIIYSDVSVEAVDYN